jgi:hypothetical protein
LLGAQAAAAGRGRVACDDACRAPRSPSQDYVAEGKGTGPKGIDTRPKPDHAAEAERLRLWVHWLLPTAACGLLDGTRDDALPTAACGLLDGTRDDAQNNSAAQQLTARRRRNGLKGQSIYIWLAEMAFQEKKRAQQARLQQELQQQAPLPPPQK